MNEQTRLYEEPVRPGDLALRVTAETVIPEGRDHAVSRTGIARIFDAGDRQAREWIERMRAAGAVILNAQDGRGYYRPADEDTEAVLRQLRQDEARAKSILRRTKHLRRWLRERGVEA